MARRVWPFAHAALTFAALAGCAYLLWLPRAPLPPPAQRLFGDADADLRQFLNVRWIGGTYELPPGDDHCAVKLLLFKDGRFDHSPTGVTFSAGPGDDRVVPFAFVWSTAPGGPEPMVRDHRTAWSRGVLDAKFCAQFTGPLSRPSVQARCEETNGYRVVGFAASDAVRPGFERVKNIGGMSFAETVESRERVIALGLRVFPTFEEAQTHMVRTNGERGP